MRSVAYSIKDLMAVTIAELVCVISGYEASRTPNRLAAASGFLVAAACTDSPVMCRALLWYSAALCQVSDEAQAGWYQLRAGS
jgi:hypothetical protein